MAVERYRGRYVTAEDAHDYIDQGTISAGCSQMVDAAQQLSNIAQKIEQLKEICNQEALSVQGVSLQGIIGSYGSDTSQFSGSMSGLSGQIEAATDKALNLRQTILNEEAKREDQRLIAYYAQKERERNNNS